MPNTEDKSYLGIRLLKNVAIPIYSEGAFGAPLTPPMKMVERRDLSHKVDPLTGRGPLCPEFDLGHVHRVSVPHIAPKLPKRRPEHSDEWYKYLVDESYKKTIAARAAASDLRELIEHHVRNGNIEIAEDPSDFMGAEDTLEDAERELVAAEEVSKATSTDRKVALKGNF